MLTIDIDSAFHQLPTPPTSTGAQFMTETHGNPGYARMPEMFMNHIHTNPAFTSHSQTYAGPVALPDANYVSFDNNWFYVYNW